MNMSRLFFLLHCAAPPCVYTTINKVYLMRLATDIVLHPEGAL